MLLLLVLEELEMNLMEKYLNKAASEIEVKQVSGYDNQTLFRECCLRISKLMKPGQIMKLQENPDFNNSLESIENEIDTTIKERRDTEQIIKKYEGFIVNALNSNY